MGELVAVTPYRTNGLQASGRLSGEQPADPPVERCGLRGYDGRCRQIVQCQRPGSCGEQPQHVRGQSVCIAAEQVIDLLARKCRQFLSAREWLYLHRPRLSQRVPCRDVARQFGIGPTAHDHMRPAVHLLREQCRDAGQPWWAEILIKPIDDKEQGTVFGISPFPGSRPQRSELVHISGRGVLLEQKRQLWDYRGQKPCAVGVGLAAR